MAPSTCIFCEIASGQREARVVLDEPEVMAFLDHRPLFPGHCLLVPRAHHETLTDLPPALVAPLFTASQRLAAAVEKGLAADGYFVAMNNRVSQSVAHLHVHVIPRRKKDGLKGFFWPRHGYKDDAEMARVQEVIRAALAGGEGPPRP